MTFINCSFKHKNITQRLTFEHESLYDYEYYENIYRQLKKNFSNQKDWKNSSSAYKSEMEMQLKYYLTYLYIFLFPRKENQSHSNKLLISSIKPFRVIIMGIYRSLSLYTESITLPILWLIIITLGLGDFYYKHIPSIIDNYTDPIYFSLSNSIPYIDKPIIKDLSLSTNQLYIVFGQKALGLILIAFFIMALRKKFR